MKDKILESYVADFAKRHRLTTAEGPRQFQHFVTHCVLSSVTGESPDPVACSTDGEGDCGIDALAVLVEGHPVRSIEEIDFFVEKLHRLNVEFVLIQSKSGSAFNAAELGTFLFGAKSFFGVDSATLPGTANEAIRDAHDLKEYIYSKSIEMDGPPSCSVYYAAAGEWKADENITHRAETEIEPLRKSSLFSAVKFIPLDAEHLRTLYRRLMNKTVCEIAFDKHTILPAIAGITEAYLGIVPCTEYLKLISDEDGDMQPGLFYDNVRDFQGMNPVNKEIASTLSSESNRGQFVLLNNGVTVVARSITKIGARFKVTDYQIVNGCQTSHVIHMNRSLLTADIFLPLKLVVTDNAEVTNRVIRATNRQTEVKDEAFESLSPFHRVLEEFYKSFAGGDRDLYYERRSKQYANVPVDRSRIVTLPMQCGAFLAMFLDEPHSTHRYYGEILSSNRGRMFQGDHRPYPYYASALALAKLQGLIAQGGVAASHRRFRYHILTLVRISAGGRSVPSLSSKKIDEYTEKLCGAIWDDAQFEEHVGRACATLDAALKDFKGDRRLAPRLRDFTAKALPYALASRARGKVAYFDVEQGFGFVAVDGGQDVFVHHTAMRDRTESCLQVGETVEFDLLQGDRGPKARDVVVVAARTSK